MNDDVYFACERVRLYKETDLGSYAIESCIIVAEKYYEHMMKWRSIKDTPVAGMWIEVLCNELGDIHTITYGPARFKDTDLGWRPAMPINIKET